MSDVGAWEPPSNLDASHARALDSAAAAVAGYSLTVEEGIANSLRQVIAAPPDQRGRLFENRDSRRLVGWLRALTLAEETIAGCEAGAKSPVIALARLLRARGDYPDDLTPWIKQVSSNRFLPYGSLMDRLRT